MAQANHRLWATSPWVADSDMAATHAAVGAETARPGAFTHEGEEHTGPNKNGRRSRKTDGLDQRAATLYNKVRRWAYDKFAVRSECTGLTFQEAEQAQADATDRLNDKLTDLEQTLEEVRSGLRGRSDRSG